MMIFIIISESKYLEIHVASLNKKTSSFLQIYFQLLTLNKNYHGYIIHKLTDSKSRRNGQDDDQAFLSIAQLYYMFFSPFSRHPTLVCGDLKENIFNFYHLKRAVKNGKVTLFTLCSKF
jgi:hypothetical protein